MNFIISCLGYAYVFVEVLTRRLKFDDVNMCSILLTLFVRSQS